MKIILFITVVLWSCDGKLSTETPVIGIVSQELSPVLAKLFPAYNSYIYASYVKAVESAGARVVPIVIGKNESYYRKLLHSINGVVLPGGAAVLKSGNKGYYDAVKHIYGIAIQLNQEKKSSPFPILGVCLGFEALIILAAKEQNILRKCSVHQENCALKFLVPPMESNMYSRLSRKEYYALQFSNSTYNWHTWCASVQDFNGISDLKNYWNITSTSSCVKRKTEFISSIEHERYPIFGIQFHPEVVSFEWPKNTRYSRSEDSIRANRYFYDTLLHYARQNNHSLSDDQDSWLIYNYPVKYIRVEPDHLREVYLF